MENAYAILRFSTCELCLKLAKTINSSLVIGTAGGGGYHRLHRPDHITNHQDGGSLDRCLIGEQRDARERSGHTALIRQRCVADDSRGPGSAHCFRS